MCCIIMEKLVTQYTYSNLRMHTQPCLKKQVYVKLTLYFDPKN